MGWLSRLLKSKVIYSPRMGILNLIGSDAELLVVEDRTVLEQFFISIEVSEEIAPICDVLFIYAQIEQDGRLRGSSHSFRELIMQSMASIVIVASENEVKNCSEAIKPTGYGQANFVMTLKRNGKSFAAFFSQLFRQMHKGISMPMAWVKMAPQGGKIGYSNCPDAMLTCEIGQVTFANKERKSS